MLLRRLYQVIKERWKLVNQVRTWQKNGYSYGKKKEMQPENYKDNDILLWSI